MPKISAKARRVLAGERRKQILAAAAHVFAAKGFERATIADVARQAGVAAGSIYNYFKGKDDLLVSLPSQIIEHPVCLSNKAMQAAGVEDSPERILTLTAQNFVGTMCQNAALFRILLSALPVLKPAARDRYLKQVVLYALGMLEAYFAEQIQRGALRSDLQPGMLARSFIGMFFPFVILGDVLQVEKTDWNYDQLIGEIVQLFLHGAQTELPERTL